eukprot:824476-Pleurochrysis_carterae.AAC.2
MIDCVAVPDTETVKKERARKRRGGQRLGGFPYQRCGFARGPSVAGDWRVARHFAARDEGRAEYGAGERRAEHLQAGGRWPRRVARCDAERRLHAPRGEQGGRCRAGAASVVIAHVRARVALVSGSRQARAVCQLVVRRAVGRP